MTKEQQFAAIPVRTYSDTKLTGANWRVLAILSVRCRLDSDMHELSEPLRRGGIFGGRL